MKCKTDKCTNLKGKRSPLCNTCRHRKEKERDELRYHYGIHKRNAKRRGIEFTISLEYFKDFAVKEELLHGKGRTATSWTIDRKDETLGYIEGNIQKLQNKDNVKKSWVHRRQKRIDYDWMQKEFRFKQTNKEVEANEYF